MCRIPDNYHRITIRYPRFLFYPVSAAFFVLSGIRPDNNSYPAGYRIITKLDLLGNIIEKEKTARVI